MTKKESKMLRGLPEELPIFPVDGIVLFPRAPLPLNIFEPRYVAMVEDVFGNGRLLGVVQPSEPESDRLVSVGGGVQQDLGEGGDGKEEDFQSADKSSGGTTGAKGEVIRKASVTTDNLIRPARSSRLTALVPEANRLCRVGALGRITEFSEEDDGRFLIVVRGLARFEVLSELPIAAGGYRRVCPNWKSFEDDFRVDDSRSLDREKMMADIVPFLGQHGFEVNEEQLAECSDEDWVNLLAQIMPASAQEKQALLEMRTVQDRARTMMAMIHMNRASVNELWPTVQ